MYRQRKLNRLKKYDYSLPGYYFVTICTKKHAVWFGEIINGQMYLNTFGNIVLYEILWIKMNIKNIKIDNYIIMPNHIHLIVQIECKSISLSNLIGMLKSKISKKIKQMNEYEFKWQKSFYDHIIRNNKSLNNIKTYIINNPKNWINDNYYSPFKNTP